MMAGCGQSSTAFSIPSLQHFISENSYGFMNMIASQMLVLAPAVLPWPCPSRQTLKKYVITPECLNECFIPPLINLPSWSTLQSGCRSVHGHICRPPALYARISQATISRECFVAGRSFAYHIYFSCTWVYSVVKLLQLSHRLRKSDFFCHRTFPVHGIQYYNLLEYSFVKH